MKGARTMEWMGVRVIVPKIDDTLSRPVGWLRPCKTADLGGCFPSCKEGHACVVYAHLR